MKFSEENKFCKWNSDALVRATVMAATQPKCKRDMCALGDAVSAATNLHIPRRSAPCILIHISNFGRTTEWRSPQLCQRCCTQSTNIRNYMLPMAKVITPWTPCPHAFEVGRIFEMTVQFEVHFDVRPAGWAQRCTTAHSWRKLRLTRIHVTMAGAMVMEMRTSNILQTFVIH